MLFFEDIFKTSHLLHLYDDEYCDDPDKYKCDDNIDEFQSVWESIRVQNIPFTEIRFVTETGVISLHTYWQLDTSIFSETLSPIIKVEDDDFEMGFTVCFLQVRAMMIALRGI